MANPLNEDGYPSKYLHLLLNIFEQIQLDIIVSMLTVCYDSAQGTAAVVAVTKYLSVKFTGLS